MDYKAKAIRTFIGAKDYEESKRFYRELGFEEIEIGHDMCLIRVNENLGFYLQKAYVRDWVDNSMIFLEVDDVEKCYRDLLRRDLHHKYAKVRLSEIKRMEWGSEVFLHDPSGILWHFGQFNN